MNLELGLRKFHLKSGLFPDCSSQNNLILHEHLYPNATRKAQRLNRRSAGAGGGSSRGAHTDREARKGSFDFLRY